jgi:DNA-binding transcriptional LysR family regulator
VDHLGDLDIFARIVTARGLSAAGRELGLSPAVISKRLSRLEERLGVRLVQRTTRQIALTEAGQGFYERVVSILASVAEAEAFVARGAEAPRGVVRISAPTSFGRLHIAPHLAAFFGRYPGVGVDLSLSDAFVDVVGENYDLVIRIADLTDSSLIARRLAPNRRLLCAAPAYLARTGEPASLDELRHHACLAHNALEWRLEGPEGTRLVKVDGPLRTNSSEVVREAVIAGAGIALRSTWDVGPELKAGRLLPVLPAYSGARNVAIHALYPSRRLLEQKVRVFVSFLAELYGETPYWDEGLKL